MQWMRFPLRSQGTRTRLPRKNNTTHTQVPSTPDPQQTTANQQQQCVVQLPTTVPMRYYPGKTERIFHHHQKRPIESTPGCTRKQALPIGISRIRCLMQHALQQRFDCALRGLAPGHKLIINLHCHSPPPSNPFFPKQIRSGASTVGVGRCRPHTKSLRECIRFDVHTIGFGPRARKLCTFSSKHK